jgi:hypothetical protein
LVREPSARAHGVSLVRISSESPCIICHLDYSNQLRTPLPDTSSSFCVFY